MTSLLLRRVARVVGAVLILILLAALGSSPGAGYSAQQSANGHRIYVPIVLSSAAFPPSAAWLAYVNGYRAIARIPSVVENAAWSTGATHHSIYVVKNNLLTHYEDSSNPWYTPDGSIAGLNGDVFASSSQATTSTGAIDAWMSAPFHALWILYPAVTQLGFGTDAEPLAGIQMAATLQLTNGTPLNVPNGIAYPVEWPGNGSTVALTSYTGGESPDPLSSCPGYSPPTGLPLIVQFSGSTAQAISFSLLQNNIPVAACAFDQTSYVNPDPSQQSTARAILQQGNAVVVIPNQPLVSGATYQVTVVVTSGQVAIWSFQVKTP